MTVPNVTAAQRALCHKFGVAPYPSPEDLKVGLARNVRAGLWPLNGLRHPVEADATGWYIWAGENFSYDPDFFAPVHVAHLAEIRPEILPYLALPPGWRFLIAPDYEDVWLDRTLLDIEQ